MKQPDISYAGSPFTFTKNSPVSGATPTNVGGVPDAWAIHPEVSTNRFQDFRSTRNGELTGTPTVSTFSRYRSPFGRTIPQVIFRQRFRSL